MRCEVKVPAPAPMVPGMGEDEELHCEREAGHEGDHQAVWFADRFERVVRWRRRTDEGER